LSIVPLFMRSSISLKSSFEQVQVENSAEVRNFGLEVIVPLRERLKVREQVSQQEALGFLFQQQGLLEGLLESRQEALLEMVQELQQESGLVQMEPLALEEGLQAASMLGMCSVSALAGVQESAPVYLMRESRMEFALELERLL
jgi:hypothetical protein